LLYYFAETLKISHFSLLKNTYLFYEGERKICFLYRYSGKKEFNEYERSLELNKHYQKTIDVSKDKVLYVMNVPDGLEDVIESFLEGKYSKLPDQAGLISFLKSEYGASENTKIVKIIRKDPGLKNEGGSKQSRPHAGVRKENFKSMKKNKHDDIRS
jgi:hypothetical protein